MSADNNVTETQKRQVVERSTVPLGKPYGEYREYLRHDFFYSCAYCTMCECEAQGIRFTIDHYEPRSAKPNLSNDYKNLMYACDPCNGRKGDRCPPDKARAAGYRFFCADTDIRSDHFKLDGIKVYHITSIGEYTIEALDLNRGVLKRIREIRQRFEKCAPLVVEGVRGLRNFKYDQLPQGIRGQALSAINKARDAEENLSKRIDALLRNYARSHAIDPETGVEAGERAQDRRDNLDRIEGLFPGVWRGRNISNSIKS